VASENMTKDERIWTALKYEGKPENLKTMVDFTKTYEFSKG